MTNYIFPTLCVYTINFCKVYKNYICQLAQFSLFATIYYIYKVKFHQLLMFSAYSAGFNTYVAGYYLLMGF